MHKKYKKYKKRYLNLKRELNDNDNDNDNDKYNENKPLSIELFIDLLQVNSEIINMTSDNDIIVLIGDTPSYIEPIITNHRTEESLIMKKYAPNI